ncbi:hypothetical protein SAMN04487911_10419 [Arenibacter nanhaiticus]|uniref:Phosphate-selective porin O and P n=1 Tax=Arenibacter nanhaiticus TaxID=558155 RepID=A0A1M6CQ75_9FLAO|nr:hypothetical protein [Arenibacter nanhaiticus]SHI63245.1 hypothetical protein SAMN04487911_10419 [Arenibacter nanhaiticus]
MRTFIKNTLGITLLLAGMGLQAQDRTLDNYRQPDKNGLNVFEAPKDVETTFDGVKVRIGGSSTLQYQSLEHSNAGAVPLKEIGTNFNLATANLDLDVTLYDGVRMHLRTYLSSRHHPEPYVKGGYFQIDKLNFINEGFMEDIMQYVTVKIGHMENNYGDAHFRRTDNAQAIYNPFVGNLIMDAFTTEVGGEVYFRKNGFISMLGVSNGKLNQDVSETDGKTGGASFLAKLGYDKQATEDFRYRITGSLYTTGYVPNSYLYSADRAGSRYYYVTENEEAKAKSNFRSGRYNPNMRNQITAVMINPFVKYGGLEFFGTLEHTTGKANTETSKRKATQYAGEVIYRFGKNENAYLGGRYNVVDAEDISGDDINISRFQLGAGWFLTKNILTKIEYVNQQYKDFPTTSILNEGEFKGLMVEAAISF